MGPLCEISGIVEGVYVDVNQPIEAGQLLASLDTARIEVQLAHAGGALAAAEARLAQRAANLTQCGADHAPAQSS